MTNFHDNAFEMDGSMHNVRVMRNMMLNSASHPFCNQPVMGGPVYWIRNIAYSAPFGSTRLTNGAAGAMFINNTILTETAAGSSSNVHWVNNLMLGQSGAPAVLAVTTFTGYSSSDYNGFKPNKGAAVAFEWNSPADPLGQDYTELLGTAQTPPPARTLVRRQWATLADYKKGSGQDAHSIAVDYDIFVKVPELNGRDPKTVQTVHTTEGLDFSLRKGAVAIDKAKVIPNITDGFTGRGPDLGALEYGKPAPHYGPR
jgi:hypothetical protein